jgi:hypothetical protein
MHDTRYEKDGEIWVWAWWVFHAIQTGICYRSNGLVLFSYRCDVQKPGLGRATEFFGGNFQYRKRGLSPNFSWILRAALI